MIVSLDFVLSKKFTSQLQVVKLLSWILCAVLQLIVHNRVADNFDEPRCSAYVTTWSGCRDHSVSHQMRQLNHSEDKDTEVYLSHEIRGFWGGKHLVRVDVQDSEV